jgi:hypothetical protein
VIFFSVRAQPAHGGLDVEDCSRELIFWREPISDGHRDITVLSQFLAAAIPALALSCAEATAVNADNRRKRFVALLRARHVELQVLIVRIAEFNILLEDNFARMRG